MNIKFLFEDKLYSVDYAAYTKDTPIVLPNGRALEAEKWLSSNPPSPLKLHDIKWKLLKTWSTNPETIARRLNGFLATEIEEPAR